MPTKIDRTAYEKARALVALRGGLYAPSDFAVIAAAAGEIDTARDMVDRKIQEIAFAHQLISRTTPTPQSPFDGQISEAEITRDAAIAAREAAQNAWFDARDERRAVEESYTAVGERGGFVVKPKRPGVTPETIRIAKQREKDAKVAWMAAREAEHAARVAATAAMKRRDNYLACVR